jgi:hypothetical protein
MTAITFFPVVNDCEESPMRPKLSSKPK